LFAGKEHIGRSHTPSKNPNKKGGGRADTRPALEGRTVKGRAGERWPRNRDLSLEGNAPLIAPGGPAEHRNDAADKEPKEEKLEWGMDWPTSSG